MTEIDLLPQSEEMALHRQIELEAKGYPPRLVQAAIKRSKRWARRITEPLPEEIRQVAFLTYFEIDLRNAEHWMDTWQRGVYGPPENTLIIP